MALQTFINTLIENVPEKHLPKKIDLVLDGGAFNGVYMLGSLFYMKELERCNKIKVNKVSGCSIGALIGLLFLLDKMDISIGICTDCYKYLRKHQDLKKVITKFKNILDEIISDEDIQLLNNRFYLTYFDTIKGEQIVKKKYKDKTELIDNIIKSLYVPYLMEGKATDSDGCIDGAFPYMFKVKDKDKENGRKVLFLNLQSLDKIKNMIFIKNEKNIYSRLLEGLMDTHQFFEKNIANNLCSYVNEWTIMEILFFRLREIVYIILVYIFRLGLHIDDLLPERFKKDTFIRQHISVFKNIWRDIMLYLTV
jgi:predicted patatin/cPLA2 family phospholipase